MTLDNDQYYEKYRDLFVTPGWKQYVEDASDSLKDLDLRNCKDWDSFLVMKTKIGMLESVVRFEELILSNEKVYEEGKKLQVWMDNDDLV
jgi:uncharacterized membrane protein